MSRPETAAGLETGAGEALACLAVLTVLARPNDDVIAVGLAPSWLEAVCAASRVRLRVASEPDVFDAIGEHTRALLAVAPPPELAEALAALGPPLVVLGPAGDAEDAVEILPGSPSTRLSLRGTLAPHGDAVARLLSVLAPARDTLGP